MAYIKALVLLHFVQLSFDLYQFPLVQEGHTKPLEYLDILWVKDVMLEKLWVYHGPFNRLILGL